MEKWNELCFILSESLPTNTSEQLFEQKVIQAFEKLGWSQFKKEIIVRESIQLGASGRINPDIIIKSNDKNLVVIEVKKPNADLNNSTFQNQLTSYMRMLRLNFGILIGSEIKLFVDGSVIGSNTSELIETIEFTPNIHEGLNFVNMFEKKGFNTEEIERYIQTKINNLREQREITNLKCGLLDSNYGDFLKTSLENKLLEQFNSNIVKETLKDFEVKIVSTKIPIDSKYMAQTKSVQKISQSNIEDEIAKIKKRVPGWFSKPNQKNSRILIRYFELKEQRKGDITKSDLKKFCKDITNFDTSYQGLKKIYDKNNGKVFDEIYGIVALWEPTKDFVQNEYEKYKHRD